MRKLNRWSREDRMALDDNGRTELHNARIEAGVTLAEAANKLGYSAPVCLWQIEMGRNMIRKEDYRFIMNYYKKIMEGKKCPVNI